MERQHHQSSRLQEYYTAKAIRSAIQKQESLRKCNRTQLVCVRTRSDNQSVRPAKKCSVQYGVWILVNAKEYPDFSSASVCAG